jgi:hypothetical protein
MMFTIKQKNESGHSTKTHLSEIQWLAKALKPDDARFHVSTIVVRKDGSAWATDGTRMHVVNYCSLSEGYYKVAKSTRWSITLRKLEETEICEVPDVDDILAGQFQTAGAVEICAAMNGDGLHLEFAKLIRKMDTNTVNFHFFEEAVSGMPAFGIKFDSGCEKPIYFTGDNRMAVVMPINTK